MKKILCYFLAVLWLCGCRRDMLNISDPANFTPQDFYKTQSDMDVAVMGSYG
jgi:hypothetical protein